MGKMFRISNNFTSGASGPILLKFHKEPPEVGGMKDCKNGHGLLTKMAAMPIYGKKRLKIFFSRTEDALGLNLCINHRGQGSTRIAKIKVVH